MYTLPLKAATFSFLLLGLISCSDHKVETQAEAPKKDTSTGEVAKVKSYVLLNGFGGRGNSKDYIEYIDSTEFTDHKVMTIRSLREQNEDFATVLNGAKPIESLGKRVRLTGYIKAKDVTGWAGLWMRIDPKDPYHEECLGFDNMENRAVKGTAQWKKYEVVLDVPQKAASIVYGALLSGGGQIWLDSMDIKIVDKSVPTTELKSTGRTL